MNNLKRWTSKASDVFIFGTNGNAGGNNKIFKTIRKIVIYDLDIQGT